MCVIVQSKILGRMWGALPEDEKLRYLAASDTAVVANGASRGSKRTGKEPQTPPPEGGPGEPANGWGGGPVRRHGKRARGGERGPDQVGGGADAPSSMGARGGRSAPQQGRIFADTVDRQMKTRVRGGSMALATFVRALIETARHNNNLQHLKTMVLTFPVSGTYSDVISGGPHDDALPRLAMVGAMRECLLRVVKYWEAAISERERAQLANEQGEPSGSHISNVQLAIRTAYEELASSACVRDGEEDDYFPCLAATAEGQGDKDRDYQLTHALTELMYLGAQAIYDKIDTWREDSPPRVRLQALKRGLFVMQAHVNETQSSHGAPLHPRAYTAQAKLVCQVSLIPHVKRRIPSNLVPIPQTPDPTAHFSYFYAFCPPILPLRCSRPRRRPC